MATAEIPVLRKAIDVFEYVVASPAGKSSREVSEKVRVAPTTCYRILQTFLRRGWLEVLSPGRYGPGVALVPLLGKLQGHPLVGAQAKATLSKLSASTGCAAKISVREGDLALTLLREDAPGPMGLAVKPGARFHLSLGASGSVLLAELSDAEIERILAKAPDGCWDHQTRTDVWRRVGDARSRGWADDSGSYRPGIFGIAVAIGDASGRRLAALTVTGLAHGLDEPRKITLSSQAREAAAALSALLG
jgi:DNA-binding IclR family transcriptional regulator